MQQENYSPRGIGRNWLPCYICNNGGQGKVQDDMAAFVDDKASGERIVAMYKKQKLHAKLDYRPSEPNWVQVKVGACSKHSLNLEKLAELTREAEGTITPEIIHQSVQDIK